MELIELTDIAALQTILDASKEATQIIFKHSTTCSISSVALNRFKKSDNPPNADYYIVDVKKQRDISNAIAEMLHVQHESPQVVVIKNGEAIYNESHLNIDIDEIATLLQDNQ